MYQDALRRLLGLIQKDLREKNPQLLMQNHLHLRQFFAFEQEIFLELPDIGDFLEMFGSPGVKAMALEGYNYLCKAVLKFSNGQDAYRLFTTPNTDEEKSWDINKMRRKGKKRQIQMQSEVRNLITHLKLYKPHSVFRSDRDGEADVTKQAFKLLENKQCPDPSVCIPAFLEHEDSKDCESRLLESADKALVVTSKEFDEYGMYLAQRTMCLLGNRGDMCGNATWDDFWVAEGRGFTAYPFAKIRENSRPPGTDKDGNAYEGNPYVRDDLYAPDVNDPDDMFCENNEDPEWQAVNGIVLEINMHKTCPSYKGYLFLSAVDTVLFKAYEEVSLNFFKAKLGDDFAFKEKCPIFLNSGFKPIISSKKPLKIVEFCARSGISPSHTAYVFRHMYVKGLYNARSALLREAEQFALCHGQKTSVKNYLGDEHKQLLAVTAATYYRDLLQKHSLTSKAIDDMIAVSEDQAKRRIASLVSTDQSIVNRALEQQERKDSFFRCGTNGNVIGERHRVALVTMLKLGHEAGVSKNDSPLRILRDLPVANRATFRLILRTFYSLPSTLPCIVTLRESLLTFCYLQDEEEKDLDIRALELKWVERLITCILTLQKRKSGLKHLGLLNVFFNIAKETQSYDYCCGNASIAGQMAKWIAVDKLRTEQRTQAFKIVEFSQVTKTYVAEVQKMQEVGKSKKKVVKSAKKLEEEDEEDEDGHEVTVTELEVQSPAKGTRITVRVETPKKKYFDKLPEDLKMMLFDDWISLTSDPALAKQGRKGLSTALKERMDKRRNCCRIIL